MATIQKRKYLNKTSYQVRIRRLGIKTITKSFLTRTEAKRWSRSMETKLDKGDYSDYSSASKVTLGDLFKRYINEEKHKKKKQWKNEEYRLRQLLLAYRLAGLGVRPITSPFYFKVCYLQLFLFLILFCRYICFVFVENHQLSDSNLLLKFLSS